MSKRPVLDSDSSDDEDLDKPVFESHGKSSGKSSKSRRAKVASNAAAVASKQSNNTREKKESIETRGM